MNIIRKEPNPSGAYPAPQTWSGSMPPVGYAIIPDTVDMADFYAYDGFVTLTIEQVDNIDTVTAYTPNTEAWEAWEAWKAEQTEPEPVEEEPTEEEDTAAMLIDHEYRLTLLELGLSE